MPAVDSSAIGQLRDVAIRLQLPLIMAQVGDILTAEVLENSVREHRIIAAAILAGDPAAAAAAMREHLERAAMLALAHSARGHDAPRQARQTRMLSF